MALFKIEKIDFSEKTLNSRKEKGLHAVQIADTQYVTLYGNEYELLKKIELKENQTTQYVTFGQWSFHQIIEVLAIKYASKDLVFSTYSISEEPVRALFKLKEKGHLNSIRALVDRRVRETKAAAFHFLGGMGENVFLQNPQNAIECHAKVAVLSGGQIPIVIVTSQNLTKNRRVESDVILTYKEAVDFNLEWLENSELFEKEK